MKNQNTDGVTPSFTKAELEAALSNGELASLEEAQALLKQAAKTNQDADKVERIADALVTATENFTKAVNAYAATVNAQKDEEVFQELSAESLLKSIGNMQKGSDEYLRARHTLASSYGEEFVRIAELADSGVAGYAKSVVKPITPRATNYETLREIRKAHDDVVTHCALQSTVYALKHKTDPNMDMRKRMLNIAAEDLSGNYPRHVLEHVTKAMHVAYDTETPGEGLEWVPTLLSGDMIERLYLDLEVAQLFRRRTMPSATFEFTARNGRDKAFRADQAKFVSQYSSNMFTAFMSGTDKRQMTAKKLAALQMVSDEQLQDSIHDELPYMQEWVVTAMRATIEDAVINGSVSLTDLDNQGTDGNRLWANTSHPDPEFNTRELDGRSMWDGLRKRAFAQTNSTVDFGVAQTRITDNMRDLRKKMGNYGAKIADLRYILGTSSHIDLVKSDQLVTLDKYGPRATIFTGEVGRVDGIPVILSDFIYQNLNASGVYDNVTKTKTTVICVHTSGFEFGDRRELRVESERAMLSGMTAVLASWRGDFIAVQDISEKIVAVGINQAV